MIFSPNILSGRRYLVTGSTGGAGSATAKLLAECGGSVTLVGRDPEKLEKVKRSLPGGPHRVYGDGNDDVYDGIFHSAAVEHLAALHSSTPESTQHVFGPSINMAVTLLAQVAARRDSIVKDGGAVVLMSSVAATRGTAGMALYAASKGAIESLVRSSAVELATRRIRVNAIRAGAFESGMHSRIVARLTPDQFDNYAARHPLGIGRASDVAQAVVFLLSDAGRWVTGSAFTIDGGYSCR